MKKTVLVIDDDKSNLIMAQRLLSDEYRVAAVNSGEKGLAYLEKGEPSLILLDIQTPLMTTAWAGKLTPQAKVAVHTKTLI